MVFVPPSEDDINSAALDVIAALRAVCGASATFFFTGSFACKLYSTEAPSMSFKAPEELNIVLETQQDLEELKRRIVQHNRRFFLVAAKLPSAPKVLRHGANFSRYTVRINIAVAGSAPDIPGIPATRVQMIGEFPVCPLALLILLRLHAWADHASRGIMLDYMHDQAMVDHSELVTQLLPHARSSVGETMMSEAKAYLPKPFMRLTKQRLQRFIAKYPRSRAA
ncbi:hypothetical protein AURDEDRAFT_117513, partial [Auricularia subglabra TFB-10046 SS5]